MTTETDEFQPPYLPFATFRSFVERLAAKPLPPRIDRSMMAGMSGGSQVYVLSALRSFGLVGPQPAHEVTPLLDKLVKAEEDDRKTIYRELLETYYPSQLAVSENQGTEAQLLETFAPLTGETRRKAETFFLHMARHVGMGLSPHFPTTRAVGGLSTSTVKRRKPRSKVTGTQRREAGSPAATVTQKGSTYTADLGRGGRLTLTVDVDLFQITSTHRDALLKIVDDVKALGRSMPELPRGGKDDGGSSDEVREELD